MCFSVISLEMFTYKRKCLISRRNKIFSEVNTDCEMSILMEHCLFCESKGSVENVGFARWPAQVRFVESSYTWGGYNILRNEEERPVMEEALEIRLITLRFWAWLTQPVILFKPPLMDHLPCVWVLK